MSLPLVNCCQQAPSFEKISPKIASEPVKWCHPPKCQRMRSTPVKYDFHRPPQAAMNPALPSHKTPCRQSAGIAHSIFPQPVGGASPSIPMESMSPGQKVTTNHAIYREDWLLCQDPKHYTVQVLGVRSEKAIASIVKSHRLPVHRQIACFRTFYKGETAYPLLWGVYRTRSEASAAVDDLPDKLKDFFPLIRRISAIQQAINANNSP